MNLQQLILQIEALRTEIKDLSPISKENEKRIWHKIRLDWNFHSNHIEGNTLSYGETKLLLDRGNVAGNITKPKRDYDEMEGHDKAIEIIIEHAKNKSPLTEAFIRELHKVILPTPYLLSAQTSDGQPTKRPILIGEYKKYTNHVLTSNGEMFYFTSPEETKPHMSALIDEFRNKKIENTKEVLFAATELHYKFIRIHPFDDGNGRLSRLLLNYILIRNDFPPVIIKANDKKNYFTALQSSDAGHFESLVIYIAEQIINSLRLVLRGSRGENVDDAEDIDKEIELLEQKLNHENDEVKEKKTIHSVNQIIDNSVLPLFNEINFQIKKLDNFYSKIILTVICNNSSNNLDVLSMDEMLNVIKLNQKDIYKIELHCSLEGFKKAGSNIFMDSLSCEVMFSEYNYIVTCNRINFRVSKLYHQALTKVVIKDISRELLKSCLDFIKTKTSS